MADEVASVAGCRGETALSLAACYGRDSIAELLLKHGADVEAKNKRGPGPRGKSGGFGE